MLSVTNINQPQLSITGIFNNVYLDKKDSGPNLHPSGAFSPLSHHPLLLV